MGTHPIFESDFDCLTEIMNRIISLQICRRIIRPVEGLPFIITRNYQRKTAQDVHYFGSQKEPSTWRIWYNGIKNDGKEIAKNHKAFFLTSRFLYNILIVGSFFLWLLSFDLELDAIFSPLRSVAFSQSMAKWLDAKQDEINSALADGYELIPYWKLYEKHAVTAAITFILFTHITMVPRFLIYILLLRKIMPFIGTPLAAARLSKLSIVTYLATYFSMVYWVFINKMAPNDEFQQKYIIAMFQGQIKDGNWKKETKSDEAKEKMKRWAENMVPMCGPGFMDHFLRLVELDFDTISCLSAQVISKNEKTINEQLRDLTKKDIN